MGKCTNVHIVLNSRDATGGNDYNALLFNAQNQNIVQGDIRHITVSEVNFPYDIPNVQFGGPWTPPAIFTTYDVTNTGIYNSFVLINSGTLGNLIINVPLGFYTGSELEDAINTAISDAGAALPSALIPAQMPTVSYGASSNVFRFNAPSTPVTGLNSVWQIESPYAFPPTSIKSTKLGKDILTIMGFTVEQLGKNQVNADPVQNDLVFAAAQSAPLVFTQYIDICSPELCKFQYMRDGSTTNLARRSDVICRLYVTNNLGLFQAEPEGTRPFIINRQLFNPRVMKWTADNSVGTIDINLYDDIGQPLTTTWIPRPYQITFNAVENAREEGLGMPMY
jgi:hypothetical protein